MEIQLIPIDRIVEDPDQPRKHQDEESLQGLADSIRQHGMLQPIAVSALASVNMYRIITGERRWRAAQRIGLERVPCIVKEVAREDVVTEQLIENLQREDLQPLEKARALQQVKDNVGATNREIAGRLGLSERAVGYLLDLLELPETIAQEVISSPNRPADGQLTEKHARFIKQLNDLPDVQSAVVDRIREERMNTEQTANLVKALKKKPEQAEEILTSPLDHLEDFFREPVSAVAIVEQPVSAGSSVRSPFVERIGEFLPILDAIRPVEMSRPEVQQVADALTAMKLAVDGLLRECRLELGEPV